MENDVKDLLKEIVEEVSIQYSESAIKNLLSDLLDNVVSRVNVGTESDEMEFREDNLGRNHIQYKRTGPLVVCIRNGIFHHLTMEVRLCCCLRTKFVISMA